MKHNLRSTRPGITKSRSLLCSEQGLVQTSPSTIGDLSIDTGTKTGGEAPVLHHPFTLYTPANLPKPFFNFRSHFSEHAGNERKRQQDEENEEQDLGDACGRAGDAAETE